MTIYVDPVSRQRISYQPNSGDLLQYKVCGGSAISMQVTPKIGLSAAQQQNQGRSNALFGTDPGMQGEKLPDIGITGENKQTTDRRQIIRRVNISNAEAEEKIKLWVQ